MAETDFDRPDLDPSQDPLWQRLDAFELDEIDAAFKFTHRLCHDNGWSVIFAHRVIEEYKKFCYLAVRAGHSVTPSDQVDQVWHLHLTYSRNYWEEFCPKVLQTDLHHDPTRGGTAEAEKFHDWYEETLKSYERMAGEPPPPEIWPSASDRFGDAVAMQRVNMARNVVLTRQFFCILLGGIATAFVTSLFLREFFSAIAFAAIGLGLYLYFSKWKQRWAGKRAARNAVGAGCGYDTLGQVGCGTFRRKGGGGSSDASGCGGSGCGDGN